MQAARPNYEPSRTDVVCPFAPRGCNPRCRVFLPGNKCGILEFLKEIGDGTSVKVKYPITDGMEDATTAINAFGRDDL